MIRHYILRSNKHALLGALPELRSAQKNGKAKKFMYSTFFFLFEEPDFVYPVSNFKSLLYIDV